MQKLICLFIMIILVSGCTTTAPIPYNSYGVGYGFDSGYVYNNYEFEIVSDPPGAKIEWNNDYIGTAPMRKTYNGEMPEIVIKAYPTYAGQFVQVKILSKHQPLPRTIYFDMNLAPQSPEYNINIQNR